MSTLEQVKTMKSQGLSEQEIITNLQEQGIPYREISEALAQSKIKAAVEESPETALPPMQEQETSQQPSQFSQEQPNMQRSMMQSTDVPQGEISQSPAQTTLYPEFSQPQEQYQQYEPYSSGISSETITEISEQVVSERMSEMRKHLNKVLDFKTSIEVKTESIEDRLKRIEKIIDALQSSVLKKVGDYVNNVDDIKKELIETQKSFSKIIPELSKHKHRQDTKHQHSSPTNNTTPKKHKG